MQGGLKLGVSWASTMGGREEQQDAFLIGYYGKHLGVFDGVGGHEGGRYFAQKLSAALNQNIFKGEYTKAQVQDYIDKGMCKNEDEGLVYILTRKFREISSGLEQELQKFDGGTTACVVFRIKDLNKKPLTIVVNIGDSRCYLRMNDGEVYLITRDHSTVQLHIDQGELKIRDAHGTGYGHEINQAMCDGRIDPDIFFLRPNKKGIRLDGFLHRNHVGVNEDAKVITLGQDPIQIVDYTAVGMRDNPDYFDNYIVVQKHMVGKNPMILLCTDGLTDELAHWLEIKRKGETDTHYPNLTEPFLDHNVPKDLIKKANGYTSESLLGWILSSIQEMEIAEKVLEKVFCHGLVDRDNATLIIGSLWGEE